LARAFEESDAKEAKAALQKALELNPQHAESLLFQADNLMTARIWAGARAAGESAGGESEGCPGVGVSGGIGAFGGRSEGGGKMPE